MYVSKYTWICLWIHLLTSLWNIPVDTLFVRMKDNLVDDNTFQELEDLMYKHLVGSTCSTCNIMYNKYHTKQAILLEYTIVYRKYFRQTVGWLRPKYIPVWSWNSEKELFKKWISWCVKHKKCEKKLFVNYMRHRSI